MKVLFVKDEAELRNILTLSLTEEGFLVDGCDNGEDALYYLSLSAYDAVIMDVNMPGMNGFSVVRRMREQDDDTPVLFLTARDSLRDRIEGLDLGGDDYMIKPFEFEELLSRLKALIRRSHGTGSSLIKCGRLILDTNSHEISYEKKRLELSSREFALLQYLMLNKGKILTRAQIEDHVWGTGYEGGTNIVDVNIRLLRKKLAEVCQEPLIETVWGIGYILKEERKDGQEE